MTVSRVAIAISIPLPKHPQYPLDHYPASDYSIHIMTSTKPRQTIIVGAGIFGLSTAIHLAHRGYTNITVFDKQPYEKTLYSYLNGCDGASAGELSLTDAEQSNP